MRTKNDRDELRTRILTKVKAISFLAPTLLRLTAGVVFLTTGWGKLQDLGQVTEFFASLGLPWPGANARLVATTEFLGGALLLVGLGTRLVALPLSFTMVVAIATARLSEVDGAAALLGLQEWDYLVMFLALLVLGPGPLSIDALLARRVAQPGPVAPGVAR
jgi:putative oxidoreductase